ncbi:GGDEF domain-containing protein [Caminibacter sp.]
MFFLFFLFTELLLCTYIFKNYSIFNKITIILSLIFFNILGFIISIQLEKFAYEIEAQRILLEKVTMIDFLTNTYNRRAFFKLSKMMINDAIRENQNIAVIMMDIDFFKKINDTYGHNTGDNVLKEFSELIKSNIRNNDLFARIGGEEFILMIKNADEPTIKQLVSKLINLIHNMSIKSNNKNIKITVSMGIYIFNPRFESLENAIKKADIALYKAKEKRDRFIFYEENLKDFLSA